jgi:hypothetical protein
MKSNYLVQDAVSDLALIRRAIEKAGGKNPAIPGNRIALDAGLIFQGLCLLIALGLLVYELLSGRQMTQIMMMSTHDPELGFLGLGQVALTGIALVMCLYFLTWRGAYHAEQGFAEYVARNFHYLRNLSFISDLLVKFIPLSLLVLAGQSQWVAPLLSLYIADYLVQGRFFSIPTRMSLVFAVISFIVAASQYLAHSVQLLWPLLHFSAVTAVSVLFLTAARREASRAAQQA